jgi:enoyl-CoA hydratase
MLTADMIDAREAYRLGLVNSVVPQGEELGAAKAMLEKIAAKAPVAVAKVIEAVNAYFQDGADGFEAELQAFGDCCGTDDFREGASAFWRNGRRCLRGNSCVFLITDSPISPLLLVE